MSIATEITRIQAAKSDIKTAIENKGVEVGDGTIDTYAEKIGEIEAGGDNFYDAFWDTYQDNGERTSYANCFKDAWWDDNNFKPKYAMRPVNASQMFSSCGVTNIKQSLIDCGVTLDLSQATNVSNCFQGAITTELPEISLISVSNNIYTTFSSMANVHTIDKVILRDDGTQYFSAAFGCRSLVNITFEGVIGAGGDVTLQHSKKLSVESMKSVITHLANLAGTDNKYKYAVKFNDVCWATLEADSTSPDGGTWEEYVTSLGWNT